jgi:hypothetical protein
MDTGVVADFEGVDERLDNRASVPPDNGHDRSGRNAIERHVCCRRQSEDDGNGDARIPPSNVRRIVRERFEHRSC